MGFTMYLAAVYLLLFVIGIAAFLKGRKNKKWLPFIIITAIMAAGIIALVCLWIASPMLEYSGSENQRMWRRCK